MAKPVFHEETIYQLVRDGILEIDGAGRIWRTAVRSGNRWKPGTARMNPCQRRRAENKPGGYLQIRAMLNGKRYHAMAHRLVWRHLHGPIPVGLTINHKNGKKADNRPDNLELATSSEQMRHAYRTGLKDQHGETNPAAKLTDAEVETIRSVYAQGHVTQAAIAEEYGVSHQTISKTVRGERRPKQSGETRDYTERRARGMGNRNSAGRFVGSG